MALSPAVVKKKGFLTKQGHIVRSWKRRFFVLDERNLFYYADESDYKTDGKPKGVLELAHTYVSPGVKEFSGRPYCFELKVSNPSNPAKYKPYYIAGESAQEVEGWLRALRKGSSRVEPKEIDPAGGGLLSSSTPDGVCVACRCSIPAGQMVQAHGKTFHDKCFVCHGCQKMICSKPETTVYISEWVYHRACLKCFGCNTILDPSACGMAKGKPHCPSCQLQARQVKSTDASQQPCEKCLKIMGVFPRVEVNGKVYHASCFNCCECEKKLDAAAHWQVKGKYYCAAHYEKVSGESVHCTVCSLVLVPGTKYVTLNSGPKVPARKIHVNCFRCASCHSALNSAQPFVVRGLSTFCQSCRDS